jgi:hypothetical protein
MKCLNQVYQSHNQADIINKRVGRDGAEACLEVMEKRSWELNY